MSKVWRAFLKLNPTWRVVSAVATLLLTGVLLFAAYKLVWYVFGGREAIRNHAQAEVSKVETNAAVEAGQATTQKVIERYEYHNEVDRTVLQGQKGVDDAYHGESVGAGVDAAGSAALCRLHPSLCRVHDGGGQRPPAH